MSGVAVGLVKSQWGYFKSHWDSLSMRLLQGVAFSKERRYSAKCIKSF